PSCPVLWQISVRQSQSLCAGEQDFILMRRAAVVESLSRLGVSSTQDSVPHVALLGSGGGQRAAVALLGSLYQMQEEGLLDTVLYLGGVSGSTWSMASLYSDPWWSSNMERAMSRLSGPDVSLDEALAWLGQRAKGEDFSLSDIWGVLTSAGIMKQLDLRRLSEDSDRNATNPYPIYSAVERSCKWFELTPHESGFTELGLFVNTSRLGSTHLEPELQMDMVSLQGYDHLDLTHAFIFPKQRYKKSQCLTKVNTKRNPYNISYDHCKLFYNWSKEHIHLTDAGIMLNMPFPPFLGDKRDTDLLIALDFSAGDVFETVTLARDYAAKVNKPFPEIDDKVLEDKDWPKDCYVFQGEGKQPTIVYMPLFNRNNCKDAEEVRQRMKEFSTFQLPFNQEKISSLLEIAKDNMKNNKETILREISKAVERRQNKR
uniref:PLA2c domain-containing protein n=1 Tax=Myripristis murdjan TaxID=586833 RepID=A0A668AW69_9TELE